MVTGPYFSVDGRDVVMYAELSNLAFHLEAIDVFQGTHDKIFAADGTILRLATEGGKWGKVVATDEVVGTEPAQLADAIRGFLVASLNLRTKRNWFRRGLQEQGKAGAPTLDQEGVERATLPELVDEFVRTQPSR